MFIEHEAPNLLFKPSHLTASIRYCHTGTAPVLFDLTKDLNQFSYDMRERVLIGAAMLRELHDSSLARDRAYRSAAVVVDCIMGVTIKSSSSLDSGIMTHETIFVHEPARTRATNYMLRVREMKMFLL